MDTVSVTQRSWNMSRIRSRDTRPELIVRSFLFNNGVRYRCNVKTLPGKPDIAVSKYRLALNIHGCFWHGHADCPKFRLPKTNQYYWKKKIERNCERDEEVRRDMALLNFDYFEIWECEIKRSEFDKLSNFIGLYNSRREAFLKNISF